MVENPGSNFLFTSQDETLERTNGKIHHPASSAGDPTSNNH